LTSPHARLVRFYLEEADIGYLKHVGRSNSDFDILGLYLLSRKSGADLNCTFAVSTAVRIASDEGRFFLHEHLWLKKDFYVPNWAFNNVILAGPATEIQRFRVMCIRKITNEECIGFDFETLVPMPAVIRATLEDDSEAARKAAMAAAGWLAKLISAYVAEYEAGVT
jgi:hypothetical protein